MELYPTFLAIMAGLFAVAAVVLVAMSLVQAAERRWRRAVVYFGLTVLACAVAAGFRFFRRLF